MTELRYECDGCGACCQRKKVELGIADLQREPQLVPLARKGYVEIGMHDSMGVPCGPPMRRQALVMVTTGSEGRCSFLSDEQRCKIHPTRPNACVLFQAGSEQCQTDRSKFALAPLLPIPPVSPA